MGVTSVGDAGGSFQNYLKQIRSSTRWRRKNG